MKTPAELLWYGDLPPRELEGALPGVELANPQCGDRVRVLVLLESEVIRAISVDTEGCAICRAVGGWLQEEVVDLPVETVLAWSPLHAVISWNLNLGPLRQKCAKLPLETLLKAIHVAFEPKERNFDARTPDFKERG